MDPARSSDPLLTHPVQPGDAGVAEAMFPLPYEELRRIAHRQLRRERTTHTLCTTALVHEAWLELAHQTRSRFASRAHLLAVASQAMRPSE